MGLIYAERKQIAEGLRRYLRSDYDAASKESAEYILGQIDQFEKGGINNVEDKGSFLLFLEEAFE